jgi:septal ring factor EnvC (AmiA/AmiB activator)
MRSPLLLALAVATVTLITGSARGQDPGSLDQLKRMYDDALGELKAAQDRKNELATENATLAERIKQLEQQLTAANAKVEQYQQEAASAAEKSFFLRSHYAAWKMFLDRYPEMLRKWKLFLGDGLTVPAPSPHANDAWPLDDQGSPMG